jgi:hypothetical protein
MSQPRKPKKGVPPEKWSVERPMDSADYLDREAPEYAESTDDDETKEGSDGR